MKIEEILIQIQKTRNSLKKNRKTSHSKKSGQRRSDSNSHRKKRYYSEIQDHEHGEIILHSEVDGINIYSSNRVLNN